MAQKYNKRKRRQKNILYTLLSVILISIVFLSMVNSLYTKAEDEAYEMLHIQTKQIKDDLTLQLKSDRENLATMANFAAKLYSDGESYNRMFDSFKPIGLLSNIGILNPDNTFVTKRGSVNLDGKISFEEEAKKGAYISGRVKDITNSDIEIIRSSVPIISENSVVGVLYGVIHLDSIDEKYESMANELDAQLFVYDKASGKFVIDTIGNTPGELSSLKSHKYNDGYSYNDFLTNDNGFSSFKSIHTGEDLFIHYSTIEEFDWGILLARYETQVFAKTHTLSTTLLITFTIIIVIIAIYLMLILKNERRRSKIMVQASNVRKLLLEINQNHLSIFEALKTILSFALSRSAFFADTDGEDLNYISPDYKDLLLSPEERKYFTGELFRYAAKLNNINHSSLGVMRILADGHLSRTNPELHKFLTGHRIRKISFAFVTDKNNRVSILGVTNPSKGMGAAALLEEIAVCFSIAIFNRTHLNKTELAATTDSLTGVLNRVSYKKDILILDKEKPTEFSCIYIDVNELHLRNNKYGHAAGDEMLIYIANTLKEIFFGHRIYRMGGDEFLVFVQNTNQEHIKKNIDEFIELLKPKNYTVAIGLSYRTHNTDCEELVREAEIRMYEAKAEYYQKKGESSISKTDDKNYIRINTGIREIDTMLSILKEHYNGIYRVSLDTDNAHRILMPAYLGYNEDENNFSKLLAKYINESVHPDSHRAVMSFLNYDAIKRHLSTGNIPKISYKKINGESVLLSIYKLDGSSQNVSDTLWVFAKD